ncbi:MAG: hypothetical protein K2K48_08025, partial [Anaeroplasmataceae bacterium]|nr:hypothetical protein [Anaeroplasmataceae bacterium]
HQYLLKLKKEDYLVVSGNGELSTYEKILSQIKCKIILDVDGKLLKKLLYIKPFLVKPNDVELEEISKDIEEAYHILLKDAEYILHTKGRNGACLISKERRYTVNGQKVQAISTVGCGDAALAGFLAYYLQGNSLKECLDFSNQCGLYRAEFGQFLIQN